jgi:hypothetical protein
MRVWQGGVYRRRDSGSTWPCCYLASYGKRYARVKDCCGDVRIINLDSHDALMNSHFVAHATSVQPASPWLNLIVVSRENPVDRISDVYTFITRRVANRVIASSYSACRNVCLCKYPDVHHAAAPLPVSKSGPLIPHAASRGFPVIRSTLSKPRTNRGNE